MTPEAARDLEAVRYCLARACRLEIDEQSDTITISHTDALGTHTGTASDLWEAYQVLLADRARKVAVP